jgi:hypothetical protein
VQKELEKSHFFKDVVRKTYAVSGEIYGGSFGLTLNVDAQEKSFQLADLQVQNVIRL